MGKAAGWGYFVFFMTALFPESWKVWRERKFARKKYVCGENLLTH